METHLKRTTLYEEHSKLKARLVDFAGWEMPVSYKGILDETRAVRKIAGLFDVSHMGTLFISGDSACDLLDRLVPSDLSGLNLHQARYSMLLNKQGGALDDLIFYRLDTNQFMIIVNASRREEDVAHLRKNGIILQDETLNRGILALQGPMALPILKKLSSVDPTSLKSFYMMETEVAGQSVYVTRTGYTGEDGFEISCEADSSRIIWNAILDEGSQYGIEPCGLGARDVLRLEAGLPLYGHELNENTNPYEVGFGWIVKLDKANFIGKEILQKVHDEGVSRKLKGILVEGKSIPRTGQEVFDENGPIGVVTSGTYSPTLDRPIAMAFLKTNKSGNITVDIRGRKIPAEIVSLPFYKRSK